MISLHYNFVPDNFSFEQWDIDNRKVTWLWPRNTMTTPSIKTLTEIKTWKESQKDYFLK